MQNIYTDAQFIRDFNIQMQIVEKSKTEYQIESKSINFQQRLTNAYTRGAIEGYSGRFSYRNVI